MPGEPLAPQAILATEFGVAMMTIRKALKRLEVEGLIHARQGLGTFVRKRSMPTVLIVDNDLRMNNVLSAHARNAGYRFLTATNPDEGLAMLESDPDIVLIFSGVRVATKEAGIHFIMAVHRRWPNIPLIALTEDHDDLAELHGKPEFPMLILPKPAWTHQIERAFQLTMRLENRTNGCKV